ncbi:hypothetical protein [Catenovulum agarivorans]|uniref:hypothetical protein n=1 Tax=Catenovulum agarivorans TaxID=1172192 RepID=UPI00036739E7|nr:hypothetical protein [Catenovulum agarivorans]
MRTLTIKFICCMALASLLLSSLLQPFVASVHSQQAQQYANDDTVLICTGAQFQWISLSATQSAGQLVFVEPPQDAPTELKQIDCSWGLLAEPAYHADISVTAKVSFTQYQALQTRLYQQAYRTFNYRPNLSRAPPAFV